MAAQKPTVAIGGASGFVGRAIVPALREQWNLKLLSRSRPSDLAPGENWAETDFFKLRTTENAFGGVDSACYLVHSMLPTGRLTQGNFSDLDLLAADNFARAAKKAGVHHIVYLGGLLPPPGTKLSPHLQSRQEVERLFLECGVPTTVLRAGLILGRDGSSFRVLYRLVKRLPALACPSWTNTPTQPVDIDDVVRAFAYCLAHPETAGRAWDLGVPNATTYREMMQLTAKVLGVRRAFVTVPFVPPRLSRLWVTAITGAPKSLIAPLVESLRTPMVVRDGGIFEKIGRPPISLIDSLTHRVKEATEYEQTTPLAFRSRSRKELLPEVRSVQRLPRPLGWTAAQAAAEYFRWLATRVPFFQIRFGAPKTFVQWWGHPLLILRHTESSFPGRELFYVEGGSLVTRGFEGRLEFRVPLTDDCFLLALHDFRPALPWWIYRFTQAVAHKLLAQAFARRLRKLRSVP